MARYVIVYSGRLKWLTFRSDHEDMREDVRFARHLHDPVTWAFR
jgi:hypothetical protein